MTKEETKFTIIRDSREQEGKGWKFNASSNCAGVEVIKLDVGDYAIKGLESTVMIERKTLGDLWGTLGNQKNYERFLEEMKRASRHKLKYLIIEATLAEINGGYGFSKVSPANILAKLFSLEVKHNVHVVFAGRLDNARTYVRSLMDKLHRYFLDGTLVPNG